VGAGLPALQAWPQSWLDSFLNQELRMNTVPSLAKWVAALAASLPFAAFAGTPNAVPEPGTWALVALAGAIGVVVARNKRK